MSLRTPIHRTLACVVGLAAAVPSAASPSPRKQIKVKLGQEFALKMKETARFRGTNASLRITSFVNSPCPKNAQCIWSGLAVVYELIINGETFGGNSGRLLSSAPYDVSVGESDYKTFARFVVEKSESVCANMKKGPPGECWRSLAKRFDDPSYCRKADDKRTKDLCLEDMAQKRENEDLCAEVAEPIQYCRYVRAKAGGDLSSCAGVTLFHWRARCFKELAEKSGRGIKACDELSAAEAGACRELVAGPDH